MMRVLQFLLHRGVETKNMDLLVLLALPVVEMRETLLEDTSESFSSW